MNKNKKVWLLILVGLLIVSLILNYKFFKSHLEKNSHYSIYMQDFFYVIRDTISQLEVIIEGKNSSDLQREISTLTANMSQLDYMISRVPYYFDGMDGLPNYIGGAIIVIDQGTHFEGKNVPPFIEDHNLNQQEIAYLKLLINNLKPILSS